MKLRWLLTVLAFTGCVVLAIHTAAMKAESVRQRQRMQRVYEQVVALEATFELERVAWRRASEPQRLVRLWLALDQRGGE
ncbi:MAG: hypothetical protein KDB80_17240 [Planctomycetes bacterium]|nr:hypothetical protein [Planctomycetota bacterium]